MLTHQAQNAFHQLIPAQVVQLTQRNSATQVGITVRVTSGTAKWTFPGDFNRKHGDPAGQDSPPGGQNFTWPKARIRDGRFHSAFDARRERPAAFIFVLLAPIVESNTFGKPVHAVTSPSP